MTDKRNSGTDDSGSGDSERSEPVVHDNRKVDPETGDVRSGAAAASDASEADVTASASGSGSEDGGTAAVADVDDLIQAEDADVETSNVETGNVETSDVETSLSDDDLSMFEQAEKDLLADMRNDMLRAQAELVNFRMRVERDRSANREAVIAEVLRGLLPTMDDLTRAETHGDLEGSPLALVAQKLRGAFEKYGLREVGAKGEPFDPNFHEALVQLPSPDVTILTIADVIQPGYALGDRLIRAAKVAVHAPAE